LILVSVTEFEEALAVSLVLRPVAAVAFAIGPLHDSFAVFLVFDEGPFIRSFLVRFYTVPMSDTIHPRTSILVFVAVSQRALTFLDSVSELSSILSAVFPSEDSLAMDDVVLEHAFILVLVGPRLTTLAISSISDVLTFVF